MPSSPKTNEMDEENRRREEERLSQRMQDIRFKILVLSGKGGVGKSTVAANLAMALVSQGKNVGLLDVDIHGPSIPTLLGLKESRLESEGEEILPVAASNRLKVVSIGFLLSKNTDAVIWRGPRKFHIIQQFLTDVRWGSLDYLVIDSPPGTGDEPMSAAQLVGSPRGAIVVTTPQDVAINDVRRCITFCRALSLPVLGIIENMSGLTCPHCGQNIDLFKSGGGLALANELKEFYLGKIPIEPQIVISGDCGEAYMASRKNQSAWDSFQRIVRKIIASNETNTKNNHGETG